MCDSKKLFLYENVFDGIYFIFIVSEETDSDNFYKVWSW